MNAELYNFEGQIEPAVKTMLQAAGFTALTMRDTPTLFKTRPRVEVVLGMGDSTQHQQLIDGEYFRDTWNATLMLDLVTDVHDHDHDGLRADLRVVCNDLLNRFRDQGSLLPYHWISHIIPSGTAQSYDPEDNVRKTSLSYQMIISLRTEEMTTES